MKKQLKVTVTTLLLVISIAVVNSVPTSVLVNTKDSKVNNFKVKRSSASTSSLTSTQKSSPEMPPPDVKSERESSFNKGQSIGIVEPRSSPQKRGVNSQLIYGDILNSVPAGAVPNGVWGDELDPSVIYPDLPEFEDYPRNLYRSKPYDNLQSILNAEAYSEPVALPVQYPYRYYGDRKKRSDKNLSYDMRLKRESKLSPADMLALVALVEAGERSRQEAENEDNVEDYQKPYFSPYSSNYGINNELNSWVDPAIDYYGMPYNLDNIPRYDIVKEPKVGQNHYSSKRYMVAKKKRSLGHFFNEPVVIPSISYENHFGSDLLDKGPRRYQKYF